MADQPRPQLEEDEVSIQDMFHFFGGLLRSAWQSLVRFVQRLLLWMLTPFLKKRVSISFVVVLLLTLIASFVWKTVVEKRHYEVKIRLSSSFDNNQIKEFSDALFYSENIKPLMKKAGIHKEISVFTRELQNVYPYTVIQTTNILTNKIGRNQIEVKTNLTTEVLHHKSEKESGLFIEPYPSPLHVREIHLTLRDLDKDQMEAMIDPLKESISNTMVNLGYTLFFRNMSASNSMQLEQFVSSNYVLELQVKKEEKFLQDLKKLKARYGDVYRFDSVFRTKSLYVENMNMAGSAAILNLPLTARIANAEQEIANLQGQLQYNKKMAEYSRTILNVANKANQKHIFDWYSISKLIKEESSIGVQKSVTELFNMKIQDLLLTKTAHFLTRNEVLFELPRHRVSFALWTLLKAGVIFVILVWLIKFFLGFYGWLYENNGQEE